MTKTRFKRMKTYRRKVQVPSKRKNRNKGHNQETPHSYHIDGSPCGGYCSCMQKEGFGMTTLYYKREENLYGDYSGLLSTVQMLLNSRCFMEYLCTCRYYMYHYNTNKKSFFTMVLCGTLRDIAMGSIHMQSTYDITRFLNYCFKWIKDFHRDRITREEFLKYYMRGVNSEVNIIHTYLFKKWCGSSLLKESTFKTLRNPLQIIIKEKEDAITTKAVYCLQLPSMNSSRVLQLDQSSGLITFHESPPVLSITSTLLHENADIVRWNDVLLLTPDSTERGSVPANIVLPVDYGESVGIYSIRTIETKESGHSVVYKRVFPSFYHHRLKKRIYDVHHSGKWIRVDGGSVTEVSWNHVQHVAAVCIHYERVSHSSV